MITSFRHKGLRRFFEFGSLAGIQADMKMDMFNPLHPGEFIRQVYLAPNGVSGRACAARLGVAPSTLGRILNGTGGISPAMAQRLSQTLGRSTESWLAMQNIYDVWQSKQRQRRLA
ncbi:HigA family addiction module antitoxin [Rugamonas sp.]|uniref:HigA family addiction module antitoxin n=1 Tax=Rugamonas sp. TaxID=1926287 RepID=UPI0025EB1CE0|nr:HigA family addiction module antitoxin [Rugamonas sp.]